MGRLGGVRRVGASMLAVLSLAVGMTIVVAMPSPAVSTAIGSGTSSSTPGASCWGIKQAFPQSADGLYWLRSQAMASAGQFYCDMTTDGGGWVLVGRGREGWTWSPSGQGTPT